MLYEQIRKEQKRLDDEIQSVRAQFQKLPDGKIYCARNQQRYKWYYSDGQTQVYLPKKERKFAEQLAAKKYLTTLYEDLLLEKKAIDAYLKHSPTNSPKSISLLTEESGYQELLLPYFKPLSLELSDWMNFPYDRNTKFPEQLIQKTVSGHYVRSKSEALIDMLLYINKIPFRYECSLTLGETIVYPDFTIRHPHTGKVYYWEHFGLMDDLSYSKNAISKLNLYTSYGIIPTVHLITTYETKDNPLSYDTIEKLIKLYFL